MSWVGLRNIIIRYEGINPMETLYDHLIKVPKDARNFIINFDNSTPEQRLEMNEFSFEIDVPEELINEISIDEVHEVLKKTPSLELVN